MGTDQATSAAAAERMPQGIYDIRMGNVHHTHTSIIHILFHSTTFWLVGSVETSNQHLIERV